MADPGEELIEQIRLELNALAGQLQPVHATVYPKNKWGIGKLTQDQHDDLPRIDWVEAGGTFEDAKLSGGNAGSIAIDAARYDVTIWHSSVENCRATLHNLRLAVRNTTFGPNMTFGAYAFVENATIKKGRKVKLAVTLKLGVSTEVAKTADIDTHAHAVTVGPEVVC